MVKLKHVLFLIFWLFTFIGFVYLCSIWIVDTPTWNITVGCLFMFVLFHSAFSLILNQDAMESKFKWDDWFLPFPKRVKFWKALKWWLSAGWRPYDKRGRRKYCSECGWKVVYLDELYDVDPEAVLPNVVAECSFCGTQFEEVETFLSKKKVVLNVA